MKPGDYVRFIWPSTRLLCGSVYQLAEVDSLARVTNPNVYAPLNAFIPWTPSAGDWVIMPNATEYALMSDYPSLECLNGCAPILGRAPKLPEAKVEKRAKPREFRVGDVVECLPDAKWCEDSGIRRQIGHRGIISEIWPGLHGCGREAAVGLIRTWPVRSLKLIKAVEVVEMTTGTSPRPDFLQPSTPNHLCRAMPVDPDAEFWRAHQASYAERNFPPLDKDGRPLMKQQEYKEHYQTHEDFMGEVLQNERNACKYAGWRPQ